MKRLILIRHAKSSWSSGVADDQSRPLNDRGRGAALKVGKWLKTGGYLPDQVLSSNATRCIQTWEGMAGILACSPAVSLHDSLYLAGAAEMLARLRTATGNTVLMLAHMPGIGEFARELRRDPPPMHEAFGKYPTAAVTLLDFRIESWADVQMGTGKFIAFEVPRNM